MDRPKLRDGAGYPGARPCPVPARRRLARWIHVTPEKIGSPVVARLIDIVEPDPAPSTVRYIWGWGGMVTVVTKSGARYASIVDAPRGSGPRGIDWKDVDTKFRAQMPDSGTPAKRIEETLGVIRRFEELKRL